MCGCVGGGTQAAPTRQGPNFDSKFDWFAALLAPATLVLLKAVLTSKRMPRMSRLAQTLPKWVKAKLMKFDWFAALPPELS